MASTTFATRANLGTLGTYARTVDSIAALSVIPDYYPDGTTVFVVSQSAGVPGQVWKLDKSSTSAVDGIGAVSTRSGSGRWEISDVYGAASQITILGGSTYTQTNNDSTILFDTSNGSTATLKMIPGTIPGQSVSLKWFNFKQLSPVAPTIIAPTDTNLMDNFSGMSVGGTAGLVPSTQNTTPGYTWTVRWSGKYWLSQ